LGGVICVLVQDCTATSLFALLFVNEYWTLRDLEFYTYGVRVLVHKKLRLSLQSRKPRIMRCRLLSRLVAQGIYVERWKKKRLKSLSLKDRRKTIQLLCARHVEMW
jgi:hypothetical protein